jgi:hypothetical protein
MHMKMKMNVCFFSAKLGHLVNFFWEKKIFNDFQKNNFKWSFQKKKLVFF